MSGPVGSFGIGGGVRLCVSLSVEAVEERTIDILLVCVRWGRREGSGTTRCNGGRQVGQMYMRAQRGYEVG